MSWGTDEVETSATGTNWVTLPAHAEVRGISVVNDTGTTILLRQVGGTVGVPIFNGGSFSLERLQRSTAEVQIKRKDESNTQVAVQFAFWD